MLNLPPSMRDKLSLGPARVLVAGPRSALVQLRSGETTRVELALFFPYQACPGDLLLVIGAGGARYAVGVLEQSGPVSIAARGPLTIRARRRLALVGDRGVRIAGEALDMVASRDFIAQTGRLIARAGSLERSVRHRLTIAARDLDEVARGGLFRSAAAVAFKVKSVFQIQGRTIRAG